MPTLPLSAAGQIALAAGLAAAAVYLLLPKPRMRSVAGGIAAAVAALAVFSLWLVQAFGRPSHDAVGTALFALFSTGALGFGTVLVAQRNPARGAIAFSFVILSTCGLFLLLAAPFLMAATVIIYAGAIIVTFLFVLMLSHAGGGPSGENDRTREPLLGSLAGFAFVGLVLFTLYHAAAPAAAADADDPSAPVVGKAALPAPVVTPDERAKLLEAAGRFEALAERAKALDPADNQAAREAARAWLTDYEREVIPPSLLSSVTEPGGTPSPKAASVPPGGSLPRRMTAYRHDGQADAAKARASELYRDAKKRFNAAEDAIGLRPPGTPLDTALFAREAHDTRGDIRLLAGMADLPARNVGNLGLLLYADHLLAVELAGTLLLVATIGAVAIAGKKGAHS